MKGKRVNFVKIWNLVAALLLLAILVCQFMPYWTLKDQTLSIGEYIWHPDDHKDFTKHFGKTLDTELDAGSIAGLHIVLAAGGIVGIWFSVKRRASMLPAFLNAVLGVFGIMELYKNPILRAGDQWLTLMILCAALIATALATVVFAIIQKKKTAALQ